MLYHRKLLESPVKSSTSHIPVSQHNRRAFQGDVRSWGRNETLLSILYSVVYHNHTLPETDRCLAMIKTINSIRYP